MSDCPCTSGKPFSSCCRPYLKGEKKAPTAEVLMRSRYSAFANHAVEYIRDTIDPDHRSDFDEKSIRKWSEGSEWPRLEIIKCEKGGDGDTEGTVEFVAHYLTDNKPLKYHEIARFKKRGDQWYYIDGTMVGEKPFVRTEPKTGRNDPCPCGSGKKYKKCCGK
jgi:SEC-C motif-containing protein